MVAGAEHHRSRRPLPSRGGGTGHFTASPDAAPAIFAEEFDGLASVVAQNVSVEIRPGPEVAVLGVLKDYPGVAVPGGVQLALGDACGDEVRRVVFELHLPSVAALGLARIGEMVIRHVAVGGADVALHEVTVPLMVNVVTPEEAAGADPDHAVVEEVLILRSARLRDDARRLAESGDVDASRALLADTARRLRALSAGSARAEELLAEADNLDSSADRRSDFDIGSAGYVRSLKQMHDDSPGPAGARAAARRAPDMPAAVAYWRSLAFACSNSASLRTPASSRLLSSRIWPTRSPAELAGC